MRNHWTPEDHKQLAAELIYEWGVHNDWVSLIDELVTTWPAEHERPAPSAPALHSAVMDHAGVALRSWHS